MRASWIEIQAATRPLAVMRTPACGLSAGRSETFVHGAPLLASLPFIDRGLLAASGLSAPAGAGIKQARSAQCTEC